MSKKLSQKLSKKFSKKRTPARGKKSRWQQRRESLLPYVQALVVPLKTIWADPLGRPGAIIFSAILLIALFAPVLATHDPNAMNERTMGLAAPYTEGAWGSIRQVGQTPLNAVSILADERAIAVGRDGVIMAYDGTDWNSMPTPTDHTLRAVASAGTGFGLAVGDGGVVLRFDGDSWQNQPVPVEVDFTDVVAASEDLALVVGVNGTVLLWDGTGMQALDSGTTQNLHGVTMNAAGEALLVGDRGTILHYVDGEFVEAEFRTFMDATFRRLHAVAGDPSGKAYAVGERGTILGYEDGQWFTVTSPENRELRDIAMVSSDEGYIVGIRGIVLRYTGDGWERLQLGYQRDFRGLAMAHGVGFAVGTDPYVNELAAPSREHLFGTTHLGRDIWSQVLWGTRTALLVGIVAAVVVNLIGVTVGLSAGYFRGRVDSILMRIVDVMYGLPLEPFAIILVLMFRPSVWIIILAISLLTWRTNARIIRSQVLSIVERPFIKAARVTGASSSRIMLVHIAPNILPLAFLQLAVAIGYAITAEATLSFLGLGPPQVYSWGTILHAARLSGAWRTAWWWVLPPGVFISITVVSVFLISRSLEVLTNPRLRGGNSSAPRRP